MIRRVTGLGMSVLVGLCLAAVPGASQQDTVILRSGNIVIGEVQRLHRGSLEFDTDEMDLVKIDWEDIAVVRSAGFFEVTLRSGEQYYGSLAGTDPGVLVVGGLGLTDALAFPDVVLIQAFERGFFARTNGYVDIGTNLTRANRLASLLAKGRFNYKGPSWGLEVTAESYWQTQQFVGENGDTTTQSTKRNESSLSVRRFLGGRWLVSVTTQAEQNQELDLDRRLLGRIGGGYQIIRTHGLEWAIGLGGTVNDELFVGEERATTGEFVFGTAFDAFDIGDVDWYTAVTTYATPAGGGRFRVELDARIAWEIISDFTIGLNVTERYDSAPPSATAAQRDYQYALSIGWSWD